jgi:hypothetical protein
LVKHFTEIMAGNIAMLPHLSLRFFVEVALNFAHQQIFDSEALHRGGAVLFVIPDVQIIV